MNDVDAFLEHHGVKGMRWGQRRNKASKTPKHFRTPEQEARREKIALGVAAGALTAGALALHIRSNPEAYKTAAKFVATKQKNAWDVANKQFQKIQVGRLYIDFLLNRG